MIVASIVFMLYARKHFKIMPGDPIFVDASRAVATSGGHDASRSAQKFDATKARKQRKKIK